MYAVVAENGGHKALEAFHPLYVPLLKAVHALAATLGSAGPSLHAYQALSLAATAVHLRLVYAIANQVCKDRTTAAFAALAATASLGLWAWSLQVMPYTLATACTLACILLALKTDAWTSSRTAALGALSGLAFGFHAACLVLIPLFLFEIALAARGFQPGLKACLAYLCGWAGVVAAAYGTFFAAGGVAPTGGLEFMTRIHPNLATITLSRSVFEQARIWRESTYPVDAPFVVLAALHGWALWSIRRTPDGGGARARLVRLACGLFAGISLFLFLNDAENAFRYAAGILSPVLLTVLLGSRRQPLAWAAALCAVLLTCNALAPARYLPQTNPGFDEARFVSARLKQGDILVTLTEPDWYFSYAFANRATVLRPAWPGQGPGRFAARVVPLGPDMNLPIGAALCSGKSVLLASSALFRDSGIPAKTVDTYAAALAESLGKDFQLRYPLISPGRQYYYPLRFRPGRRACARDVSLRG